MDTVNFPGASPDIDFDYDPNGNLTRAADGASRYQSYDARGNTTNDGLHGFAYDRSERPVSISGGATGSFVYDAHGRRVKQTLDGETVYTVYGLDGTLLYRDNATTGETTDYITMGGHSVGRFDQTGTFHWIHTDHLGSAAAASRADGTVRWREHYTPFGEVQNDPGHNRDQPGFTGHVRDAATGLTYAQARYYNPVTARFLSPDPVGFAGGGPGYFNRYAYTANDPVNLVDPTGEETIAIGLDAWFDASAFDFNRDGLITVTDTGTGNVHTADGGMVGLGVYLSIPIGEGWQNERLDIGVYVTGGASNLNREGAGSAHENDVGAGVGLEISGMRGDGRTMSGRGGAENYDASIVGGGVLLDANGRLLGGSAGVGIGLGLGDFETNTKTYGAHDLFYDMRKLVNGGLQ